MVIARHFFTAAALVALVAVAIPAAHAKPPLPHKSPLPDDPLLAEQWYLRAIGAPAAWSAARGARPITVAVLDTGAALHHPDLAGRIAGVLDRLEHGEEEEEDDEHDERGEGEAPFDRVGHGTGVAGIIAAEHGNGIGIAGVAPNARLLVVKIARNGGSARPRDLARGLTAAVDRGARVVNMSVETEPTEVVRAAVAYAIRSDVLLVAVAGNGGGVGSYFSDPFPEMLVVGSTDHAGLRAGFSNHGAGVDLGAPGVDLLTLYRRGRYGPAEYTSFSAPQVAGAAALLRGLHPDWSAARVAERLCATADRTAGAGQDWRCGRLNLARAVGA